jgi:DnaJ-class molecular chaperone
MEKFDHASSTGWALNKFHQKLECAKCHGNKTKFTKLNNDCLSCHKNFEDGTFNHKVTGLELDDIHKEAGCTDCHQTKNFSKPACTNCHEDKSFPKDKPGKLVKM